MAQLSDLLDQISDPPGMTGIPLSAIAAPSMSGNPREVYLQQRLLESLKGGAQAAAAPMASPYGVAPPAGGYITQLPANQQPLFNAWVKNNKVPYDPSPTADYDMPGFWKALMAGDPKTQTSINANDGRIHFDDYWKTPYHQSFSNQSKFAKPDAPKWNDKDQLIDKNGKVVFDERARK